MGGTAFGIEVRGDHVRLRARIGEAEEAAIIPRAVAAPSVIVPLHSPSGIVPRPAGKAGSASTGVA